MIKKHDDSKHSKVMQMLNDVFLLDRMMLNRLVNLLLVKDKRLKVAAILDTILFHLSALLCMDVHNL